MNINEIHETDIFNLDHQGRGIGRINNKVIFIPGALIGEKVRFRLTTIKKRYLEGELVDLISKSNKRVEPPCPYFHECGGCDLMHMSYEDQINFKQNKIKELITKFTNVDDSLVMNIIDCDNHYNYRNKITLHVNKKLGLYKKRTNDIITIDHCLISNDNINKVIKKLNNLSSFKNISKIVIRTSEVTNETMIVFYVIGESDEGEIIKVLKKDVSSIIKYKNNYETIYGKSYITERIKDMNFIISPSSFFQVNTKQTIKLYDQVLKFANLDGTETIIDLFCGTGTIGLYLSRFCKQVIGVEINEDAIKDALENKKINNIKNIDFICGDVNKIINTFKKKT